MAHEIRHVQVVVIIVLRVRQLELTICSSFLLLLFRFLCLVFFLVDDSEESLILGLLLLLSSLFSFLFIFIEDAEDVSADLDGFLFLPPVQVLAQTHQCFNHFVIELGTLGSTQLLTWYRDELRRALKETC